MGWTTELLRAGLVVYLPGHVEWDKHQASSRYPFATLCQMHRGGWGCGAFHGTCWFQLQWPESWASVTIAPKELVLIVVAATSWGFQWPGRHVQYLWDNAAVVHVMNKGVVKNPAFSHVVFSLNL